MSIYILRSINQVYENMSIKFNENGTLKPSVVNYPVKTHNDETKEFINKIKQESKGLIKNERGKVEKREFFCNKHKTFHKHRHGGKPSITYQKCLKTNFYKFKSDMENYELFKISFKKGWKQEKADYYKSK